MAVVVAMVVAVAVAVTVVVVVAVAVVMAVTSGWHDALLPVQVKRHKPVGRQRSILRLDWLKMPWFCCYKLVGSVGVCMCASGCEWRGGGIKYGVNSVCVSAYSESLLLSTQMKTLAICK